MANRPATVRQADVTRVLKGAVAAGFDVGRVEIEGGKIVLYGKGNEGEPVSPLDAWRQGNGQG